MGGANVFDELLLPLLGVLLLLFPPKPPLAPPLAALFGAFLLEISPKARRVRDTDLAGVVLVESKVAAFDVLTCPFSLGGVIADRVDRGRMPTELLFSLPLL